MSTLSRWISGTAASWAKIFITIFTQVALVPLYLAYWDVETFGIWVAIQALVTFVTIFDYSHQTLLEFEFLRFGDQNKPLIRKFLWSGVAVGLVISLLQLGFIYLLIVTGGLSFLLDAKDLDNPVLLRDAGIVLFLHGVSWMISFSCSGLLGRALSPFGYFSKVSWWGVGSSLLIALSTAVAVVLGSDLLVTGIVANAVTILYSLIFYGYLFTILRKEKIVWKAPSWGLGIKNFLMSNALSGKFLLDLVRQQGIRLFLAPIAGLSAMAAFSTMRTGAYFAIQGLNTITNPMMPELMRFLHNRDQARSSASFAMVWIVVVGIIAPALMIIQLFIEPLFEIWTRGKIEISPLLFGSLSITVLIFAWAQPAFTVLRGNNMLKPQLYISIVTAAITIAGIFLIVPKNGIIGAGIALLVAEIFAAVVVTIIAAKWMVRNGLQWPRGLSGRSLSSVVVSSIAIFLVTYFPEFKWAIVFIACMLLAWNLLRFWSLLPGFAKEQAKRFAAKLPGCKHLLSPKMN